MADIRPSLPQEMKKPKREPLDFGRLTGHDLAKVLNKMPGKFSTRLVQTNRQLFGMAKYLQSAFSYRKRSIIVYCDADEVFLRQKDQELFYYPDPEDENRYFIDELIIGIASNEVNLLDLPSRLPPHLKCRRLIIRTYHPFISQINSLYIEGLFAHFGARDLELHLVPIFGELCIKPAVAHLSYFVIAEEQIVDWIYKFPFAPYMFLDFAGLSMSQVVKVAVGLWTLGRLPYQKWIRIRVYRDAHEDLEEAQILQECAEFLVTFPNHVVFSQELKVEEILPYRPMYRVIIPKSPKCLGVVLFSEPSRKTTMMGRRESIVDFFPGYNLANGYDPNIFDPMTIDDLILPY